MIDFGNNLRNARKSKHLKQNEIAELVKIAQTTYSCYEINKRQPDFDTFRAICLALDCSADEILEIKKPAVHPVLQAYLNADPAVQEVICNALKVQCTPPSQVKREQAV